MHVREEMVPNDVVMLKRAQLHEVIKKALELDANVMFEERKALQAYDYVSLLPLLDRRLNVLRGHIRTTPSVYSAFMVIFGIINFILGDRGQDWVPSLFPWVVLALVFAIGFQLLFRASYGARLVALEQARFALLVLLGEFAPRKT